MNMLIVLHLIDSLVMEGPDCKCWCLVRLGGADVSHVNQCFFSPPPSPPQKSTRTTRSAAPMKTAQMQHQQHHTPAASSTPTHYRHHHHQYRSFHGRCGGIHEMEGRANQNVFGLDPSLQVPGPSSNRFCSCVLFLIDNKSVYTATRLLH